jgi:signal transduction histidine kinase
MQELRHSSELRRTLAAQSHKVNAALQAIFGKVSTLTRLSRETNWSMEVEKDISREVAEIRKILERLKVMDRVVGYASAMADGKAPLSLGEIRPVNLHNLVQDCVSDFRELAAREGVRVQYRGGNALVMGSKTHLHIIVNNILDNAIKYSFGGQEVLVQLGVVGREVRLVVTNYGIGVPESEQDRVFELYWRANVPYGRKVVIGSGIGLTVAQIIAQAHGGKITFNSYTPHRSERYVEHERSYSESDFAKGLCHTVAVTLVLPIAGGSEKGSEHD